MSQDVDVESPFNPDDDVDALSVLQADAYDHRVNHEVTAKAFGAVEALTEAFSRVCDEKVTIVDAARLVENVRRLAHIMEDYYAANPQ